MGGGERRNRNTTNPLQQYKKQHVFCPLTLLTTSQLPSHTQTPSPLTNHPTPAPPPIRCATCAWALLRVVLTGGRRGVVAAWRSLAAWW